jgi:DNA polymerase III alpha subunit
MGKKGYEKRWLLSAKFIEETKTCTAFSQEKSSEVFDVMEEREYGLTGVAGAAYSVVAWQTGCLKSQLPPSTWPPCSPTTWAVSRR